MGFFDSIASGVGNLLSSSADNGVLGDLGAFVSDNSKDIGTALKAGGVLSSGLSGSPTQPSSTTAGFAALPPAVQNAWLQIYLPAALSQAQKGYQAPALKRASTTPGMFDSQGLADLQKYSDQVGGLFGKTGSSPIAPNYGSTLAGATNATGNSSLAAADAQTNAMHGMSLSAYVNQNRPDVAKALGYTPGQVNASDPNVINWWTQYGSKGN